MEYRLAALPFAREQVGVKESPAGTNDGPMVRKFQAVTGEYRQPWCASFVQWCLKQAGMPQPFLERTAYVPYIVGVARQKGWTVTIPAPGDLACYDWQKDGVADHVGFVYEIIDHRTFRTIEGNTAIGQDSNGGEVMIRTRSISDVQAFVRVPGTQPDHRPQWAKDADSLDPMWAWFMWKDHDAPEALRPKQVPAKIPAAWWVRYKLHIGAR